MCWVIWLLVGGILGMITGMIVGIMKSYELFREILDKARKADDCIDDYELAAWQNVINFIEKEFNDMERKYENRQ